MPTCKRCDHTGATADFRRSPSGGHLCNDKTGCERRRVAGLNDWLPLIEQAHTVAIHASAVEHHVGDTDTMRALGSLRVLADAYAELAVQLAQAAVREGKTVKAVAETLDVPPSQLRGLKQSVAA
jgi:hypothetical protein